MRRRRALTVSMTILMMLCVSFAVPAPSLAASVTNKQTVPGLTQRTIWDTSQVLCYRLPDGINHAGYIHMELTFCPAWVDLDLYLLDENGQALSQEMGSMAAFVGREVVDFNVMSVRNQTIEPGASSGADDARMTGDTYYVVVVAFNGAARCRVAGYYPQIDLAVSADTTATDNYYLKSFRRPADTGAWVTLDGPEYGYPYDFTPTSTGQGEVRLEWPANVQTRSVTYDRQHAPSPANMESYLYAGSSWETVFQDFGESNWTPPDQGGWYGLRDTFAVEHRGTPARPLRTLHWVPSLFLKASDETRGPLAPPRCGKSTVGFKGTLLYPENLRLASAPQSVRKGGQATIKGTFARGGAWAVGVNVAVQVRTNGGWKTAQNVRTDGDGRWTAVIRPTRSASYRAVAAGDPVNGFEQETSVTRRITVR
ncbi:MAG TPA: hypothetical protein PK838_09085 [Thermoleophilia bacterium]|nr:hypothetical protein [Thermoleophilia bacterium]